MNAVECTALSFLWVSGVNLIWSILLRCCSRFWFLSGGQHACIHAAFSSHDGPWWSWATMAVTQLPRLQQFEVLWCLRSAPACYACPHVGSSFAEADRSVWVWIWVWVLGVCGVIGISRIILTCCFRFWCFQAVLGSELLPVWELFESQLPKLQHLWCPSSCLQYLCCNWQVCLSNKCS